MHTFDSTTRNDFSLNGGRSLSLITGINAVAQTARQHMQARRGEMFLATGRGMPFDPLAWAGEPNVAQFEAAGIATLLQVPGVVAVLSFTARLVENDIDYVAVIQTIYGEVSLIGQL